MTIEERIAEIDAKIMKMESGNRLGAMQKHNIAKYGQDFYGNVGEKSKFGAVDRSELAKAPVGKVEKVGRLEGILDSGNVYDDGLNAYQRSGINVSNRTGSFLGDIVGRLLR